MWGCMHASFYHNNLFLDTPNVCSLWTYVRMWGTVGHASFEAFLEMEHGVPAGKILARTHKAVSMIGISSIWSTSYFLSIISRTRVK